MPGWPPGRGRDTAGQAIWRTYHRNGWDALRNNRLELAESLFRAGLQEAQALPPGDPRMAATYNDLAWVFLLRDKADQAEPLARWALQAREVGIGPNSPEAGDSLIALARIQTARKQYDEAEALARRALRIYMKSKIGVEDKHPPYAYDVLGQIEEARGNLAQAEALYLRALNLRESALGLTFDDPRTSPTVVVTEEDVAASYRRLAELMRRLGRNEEAEALDQKAEEIEVSPPPAPGGGGRGLGGNGIPPLPGGDNP